MTHKIVLLGEDTARRMLSVSVALSTAGDLYGAYAYATLAIWKARKIGQDDVYDPVIAYMKDEYKQFRLEDADTLYTSIESVVEGNKYLLAEDTDLLARFLRYKVSIANGFDDLHKKMSAETIVMAQTTQLAHEISDISVADFYFEFCGKMDNILSRSVVEDAYPSLLDLLSENKLNLTDPKKVIVASAFLFSAFFVFVIKGYLHYEDVLEGYECLGLVSDAGDEKYIAPFRDFLDSALK